MSNFFISPKAYKILQVITAFAVTSETVAKFPLDRIDYKKRFEFALSNSSTQMRFFFLLSLWIIQLLSMFRYGRCLTNLKPTQKDKYLKWWASDPSYLNYLVLRPLLAYVYSTFYSHPDVSESLGFTEPAPSSRPPTPIDNPDLPSEIDVEVCVIGSGAGGAVVAKELAEKGHRVLIVEEGGHFGLADFNSRTTHERNTLIYRDGGMVNTFGSPMILVPTGRAVGGTTLINSGTCFRTPSAIIDKWESQFNLKFNRDKLNYYFDRVEEILHIETTAQNVLGGNNELIEKGIKKLGLHGGPLDRNVAGCVGSGVCIFGCPTGAKQSMERSYLPLAIKAGSSILAHCRVQKLHKKGDKITHAEAYLLDPTTGRSTKKIIIRAEKFVLACGTFLSPLLLKRSGVGRTSCELGRNLTLHPTGKVIALFDEVIDGHKGVPQGYQVTDYHAEGMMFETVFLPPWLLATSLFETGQRHREMMEAYRHVGIFGFLIHDEGRGRVFESLSGKPLIWYTLGKKEQELHVKGLKVLAEILFAAGAKKVYPTLRKFHDLSSRNEIAKINSNNVNRRDLEMAAFHPLGTCRMGVDPRRSVIDENLRVHDVQNLWVADGSIFPTSLGVNPQVSIMAFATRCAEEIHGKKNP